MKRSLDANNEKHTGNPSTNSDPKAAEEEDDDEEHNDDESAGEDAPLFQCWDDVIVSDQALDSLVRDAKTLWKNFGGDKSTAKSFWVDANVSEPRCTVEALALEIADFHLQGAEYTGVEVWTQFRAADAENAGLEFHFDKDEKKIAEENEWKHPVVATATYLTTGGAPLVVFSTASPEGCDQDDKHGQNEKSEDPKNGAEDNKKLSAIDHSSKRLKMDGSETSTEANGEETLVENPSDAWICFPVKARHAAFAGNLLHGVTQELVFGAPSDRLSLLVNIWLDHKPSGVEVLPDPVIAKLNQSIETVLKLETDEDRKEAVVPVQVKPFEPLRKLKEHVDGETAPLPVDAIRAQFQKDEILPPVLHIPYATT